MIYSVVVFVCIIIVGISPVGCEQQKETPTTKQRLLVLTVATEATDGYLRFMRSAQQFNLDVEVLGLGEQWLGGDMNHPGGGFKVNLLRKALQKRQDDSELIVMFTDSYDVIANADADEVLGRLAKFFQAARVVFSAEGYCWPDRTLANEYPLVKVGKRYLNSGMFIGYIGDVLALLQREIHDEDDDQLYYTKTFLNENIRKKHKIELDTMSKLFQNLHGVTEDVALDFSDNAHVKIHNAAYNTKPCFLHGNGPVKVLLNYYGNYIGNSWNLDNGCTYCNKFCLQNKCDYMFMVDSEAHLNNPSALKLLLQQNRGIITPMMIRPKKLWSSFWGALDENGFYARSDDYMAIVQKDRIGAWNVPYVRYGYLIRGDKLEKMDGAFAYDQSLEADMSFAKFCRDNGHFMFVDNQHEYGKLINSDDFDMSRVHPELWEIFNNREEFERRYIPAELLTLIASGKREDFSEPCPDVYDFPLFTERFCWELIEVMEKFGEWSNGKNEDERIQGGYENVPTRDIHMKQIELERHFLYIIDEYVRPIQEIVYTGYYKRPVESHMMFVVRFRADEQPSLKPHHDASTFSIDIALNRRGIDFHGGGVHFLRYNCSVLDHQQGWSLMFPGRLTHMHEGLATTEGTRYVGVSFINP